MIAARRPTTAEQPLCLYNWGGNFTVSTFMAKASNVERQWYVIDAEGLVLGRLASQIALILRGKHNLVLYPHGSHGDKLADNLYGRAHVALYK